MSTKNATATLEPEPQGKPIGEIGLDAQRLIEVLSDLDVGATISYAALSNAIDRDVQNGARGVLRTATRFLQRENRIVFKTIRGEGLMRLDSEGIVNASATDVRRIGRAAGRAIKKLSCANESDLSAEQRHTLIARQCGLGAIHAVSKPAMAKKIESAVKKTGQRLPLAGVLEAIKGS